jgi:UDP-N-acetylglucosamine acyltransferase
MTNSIHPTAVIASSAEIGEGCVIGPFCIIGPKVKLGNDCNLHSHIVVDGDTHIGEGCIIFPFTSIGVIPQDLKYNGEDTKLRIGARNKIRENVTIHLGTVDDNSITKIGDDNLFMVGAHVAHDCVIGNGNVFANNATLAGHVHVGNNVVVGGLSAVHQFCRIGDHAMIGGMSGVENDVIPYGLVMGERARLAGLNLVGLERRGFDKADMKILMKAFKTLFMGEEGTFKDRLAQVSVDYKDNDVVMFMLDFAQADNARPLCQPK